MQLNDNCTLYSYINAQAHRSTFTCTLYNYRRANGILYRLPEI